MASKAQRSIDYVVQKLSKLKRPVADAAIITASSLAFSLELAAAGMEHGQALTDGNVAVLQALATPFDAGAGLYAGISQRQLASELFYAATLLPEAYIIASSGDVGTAARMALIKTFVCAGGLFVGYFARAVVKEAEYK